ncbi:MAG: hypothetical protein MHM6MM_005862 [Cercozoa sp. M6MM]
MGVGLVQRAKDYVLEETAGLRRLGVRGFIQQVLSIGLVLSGALMTWKLLMLLTNSPSPVVVVLTASMEPAIHRGDILVLNNQQDLLQVGDIVVYQLDHREIPIIHRVLETRTDSETGEQLLLTKGDNNRWDDRGLYNKGQMWLKRDEHVLGRAIMFMPSVGYVTIALNENPMFKALVLGGILLYTLVQREDAV